MMKPNEATQDAMREARMLKAIRDLLKHAVWDREKSDECIDAVEYAEKIISEHTITF